MTSVPMIGLSQATPTDSEYFWHDRTVQSVADCFAIYLEAVSF